MRVYLPANCTLIVSGPDLVTVGAVPGPYTAGPSNFPTYDDPTVPQYHGATTHPWHMVPSQVPHMVPSQVPGMVYSDPHAIPQATPGMVPTTLPSYPVPYAIPQATPGLTPQPLPTYATPHAIPQATPGMTPQPLPTYAVPYPIPQPIPQATPVSTEEAQAQEAFMHALRYEMAGMPYPGQLPESVAHAMRKVKESGAVDSLVEAAKTKKDDTDGSPLETQHPGVANAPSKKV